MASCGQADILIGREMHGERKARLDFFTIRRYFFNAFSVASVRRSIISWSFENFLA